ncbi:MAG TPA: hypothetical protein DC003_03550 [Acholeplasmataceae bacterium]|nr:hypothetical protein [Acholeplasmataceae bacterium]
MIFDSKHQARADIRGKVLKAFFAIVLTSILVGILGSLLQEINPFPVPVTVMGENFWEQPEAYTPKFLPGTIFNMVTSLALSFFFTSVLSIGLNNFFIRNGQQKELDVVNSLFIGFKTRYIFILKTLLTLFLAVAIYAIPIYGLMVVGLIVAFIEPIIGGVISLIVFIGFIFLIIKLLDYSFVIFLLADEDVEFDQPKAYLEASKQMIKGYKFDFVLLGLSFILWFIASAFTFFLLLIWLLPYMYQSYANFYLKLKPKKEVAETSLETDEM